jgi:hypothetical protein
VLTWHSCECDVLDELAPDGLSMAHVSQEVRVLLHTRNTKRAALRWCSMPHTSESSRNSSGIREMLAVPCPALLQHDTYPECQQQQQGNVSKYLQACCCQCTTACIFDALRTRPAASMQMASVLWLMYHQRILLLFPKDVHQTRR